MLIFFLFGVLIVLRVCLNLDAILFQQINFIQSNKGYFLKSPHKMFAIFFLVSLKRKCVRELFYYILEQ